MCQLLRYSFFRSCVNVCFLGIESRLSHIADIGAETIWISPVYESPMKDFGYDISNFTNIDPTFGTLSDFQRMSARAHELGVLSFMLKYRNV